jgi:KUP system potassium uptake protein
VSREAQRLGFLPRLTVRQTSEHERGQIYVPSINWLLCIGVLLLVAVFQTSERLATAYGLAVTGTLLLTTTLLLVHARTSWRWGWPALVAVAAAFGVLELAFFAANLTKVVHGGWLPLLIASSVTFVMLTWRTGGRLVTERRTRLEGPIDDLVHFIESEAPHRVPGTAIFLHPDVPTIPLALRINVHLNRTLHDDILIVSTVVENVPHVSETERVVVETLGSRGWGVLRVVLHFGFKDEQNIPMTLLRSTDERLHHEHTQSVYFLSRTVLERGQDGAMSGLRKRLFIGMAHNAASPITHFRLPQSRTVSLGSTLYL